MKGQCCFCNRQVLGIAGLDAHLDTFYLREGEPDETVASDRLFGDAHSDCLASSKWSEFWTHRQAENLLMARRLVPLLSNSQHLVAVNKGTQEFAIIRNGTLFWIPCGKVLVDDNIVDQISMHCEVSWNLEGNRPLADKILLEIKRSGFVKIGDILAEPERASLYAAAASGIIRPYSDDPEATFDELSELTLVGEAEYIFELTDEEIAAISSVAVA